MACSDAHSLIQERLGSGLDSALGGFPNELLLEIIVNLGRGDLTSLCLTSRALSALACSILYTCIDLRSEASIGFFCRTLVGSESKRQTVLHLKLSGLQSTISDEISAQFSETLQLMNRLRILNIEASLVTESFLSFLREWTCESLEEVRFNISSASSQVAPFLTSFLNRHPALTRLYIVATRFPSLPGLPDIRLPKLAFFLGPVSYFRPLVVVDRKLELVTLIGYYHTGETIGAISALEHMASSESIKLHVVTLRYDAAFMHAAAHSVPHTLSLLSFNCLEMRGRFDQSMIDHTTEALARFTALVCFEFDYNAPLYAAGHVIQRTDIEVVEGCAGEGLQARLSIAPALHLRWSFVDVECRGIILGAA